MQITRKKSEIPRHLMKYFKPVSHALKQGNLILEPHRLALALQGDGWIVRNDVVWQKKSPMPESVAGWSWQRHRIRNPEWKERRYGGKGEDPQSRTERLKMNVASAREAGIDHEVGAVSVGWADCPSCPACQATGGYVLRRGSWRHTRSHETVLMLAKSMGYFADQEAVREAVAPASLERMKYSLNATINPDPHDMRHGNSWKRCREGATMEEVGFVNPAGRNPRSVRTYDDPTRDLVRFIPREAWLEFLEYWAQEYNRAASNPADVLTPSPSPYAGAHYATYPPDLIRDLIRASTPKRCCPECGAGWAAVVEKEVENRVNGGTGMVAERGDKGKACNADRTFNLLGYRPTCACVTTVCAKCKVVVQSWYENQARTIRANLPSMQQAIQGATLLQDMQPGMQERTPKEKAQKDKASTDSNLPELRQGIHFEEIEKGLFPTVFQRTTNSEFENCFQRGKGYRPGVVERQYQAPQLEGLHPRQKGIQAPKDQRSSDGRQKRMGSGASRSDGRKARSDATSLGAGSPHKWNKERQPPRKFEVSHKEQSLWDSDLSSLPHDILSQIKPCLQCNSYNLVWDYPIPVNGIVLDPFVGSGTTLEVAREEGLNAIGLDLSYEYLHDQARDRLGFVALAEWERGKDGAGASLAELPLFAEVTE